MLTTARRAIAMDVTGEEQVNAGMRDAIAHFGTVHALIANAGIQHISPFADLSLADWQQVLPVHVDGTFLAARAAFRHWIEQGQAGTILVMGSVHSHLASPFKAPYITAKHGLAGLMKAIAREGGPHNIRSYLICPGFDDTPLARRQIPLQAQQLGISEEEAIKTVMLGSTVDGQFTTVDELAEVALFLAGFPGNALTGQAFVVSHGADMH